MALPDLEGLLRLPTSGSQSTFVSFPPEVGSAGRPQMAPLAHPLRGLWNGLERARKSLGVCSFGFFAFSLVSIVGQGAPAPEMVYRVDPAAAAAAAALDSSSAPLPAATPPAAPPPPVMPSPKLGFDRALGVPRTPFGKQIYKVALRYALNPHLVAAVVQAESDFNPRARSRKGACGLMQVLPSTARRFGLHRRRDLFNPTKNLDTGARYLRWLVDRFGDDAMRVLAAYNSGEGNVERFGGLPPFPETRGYVQHIFARLGFTLLLPALTTPAPAALPAVDSALLAGSR
jgi:hypothetical protein